MRKDTGKRTGVNSAQNDGTLIRISEVNEITTLCLSACWLNTYNTLFCSLQCRNKIRKPKKTLPNCCNIFDVVVVVPVATRWLTISIFTRNGFFSIESKRKSFNPCSCFRCINSGWHCCYLFCIYPVIVVVVAAAIAVPCTQQYIAWIRPWMMGSIDAVSVICRPFSTPEEKKKHNNNTCARSRAIIITHKTNAIVLHFVAFFYCFPPSHIWVWRMNMWRSGHLGIVHSKFEGNMCEWATWPSSKCCGTYNSNSLFYSWLIIIILITYYYYHAQENNQTRNRHHT